jgi:hypothetical protein
MAARRGSGAGQADDLHPRHRRSRRVDQDRGQLARVMLGRAEPWQARIARAVDPDDDRAQRGREAPPHRPARLKTRA